MPLLPLIAVIGPTASGKTRLGCLLAQRFGGEIVSADAKQVYRRMDIGTAKEKDLPVRQHLIDIKEPGEGSTAAGFQSAAYAAIDGLHAKGTLPFLVGGSGLYAEAVLNGYAFAAGEKSRRQSPLYRTLKIGIEVGRPLLRRRVAERTQEWLRQGLLGEIEALLSEGVSPAWLYGCGQEYRYFTAYLQGEIGLEEAVRRTNTSINQYVKRQYTWWRRHPDMHWVVCDREAQALVADFLGVELR